MSFETITLQAGGREFNSWKSVEVVSSVDRDATVFTIETVEVAAPLQSPFEIFNFRPRTQVRLLADGDLLCAGRVFEYLPLGFPGAHTVRCSAGGFSRQLTRSSPDHPTGFFENQTLLQIAQTLAAPFGVTIEAIGLGAVAANQLIPVFQIRRGSTVWAEIVRLAQQHGVTLYGNPEGGLDIIRGTIDLHAGAIVQGGGPGMIPIESMSGLLRDEAFAKVIALGQSAFGTDEASLEPEGVAVNGKIEPYCVFECVNPEESSPVRLQAQADWLMARSIGESAQAVITVPTFRDIAGKLWRAGNSVFLHSGWLKISQIMAITEVRFQQDSDGGTRTQLTLKDPRAVGGEAPGESDTGPEYDLYPD
jgi:prophage tail gpP-like protein